MSGDPPDGAESEALARYRAASRRRAAAAPRDRRRAKLRTIGQTTSGPAADARDPQRVGDVWRSLADGKGWTSEMAVWSLTNRWADIVGPQVAEHVAVVAFDPQGTGGPEAGRPGGRAADPVELRPSSAEQTALPGTTGPQAEDAGDAGRGGGRLTLRADSPAWQQQMIWNLALLQRRLDAELGVAVVGRIVVLGPQMHRPSFGPRRARS